MIKILLVIFTLTILNYGQTPTPTPRLPIKNEAEMIAQQNLNRKKQQFDDVALFESNGNGERIALGLSVTRKLTETDKLPELTLFFDFYENFSERQIVDKKITSVTLKVDDKSIPIPPFNPNSPVRNLPGQFAKNRIRVYRMIVSPEEIELLKKATQLKIIWDLGEIVVSEKGLLECREFVTTEFP